MSVKKIVMAFGCCLWACVAAAQPKVSLDRDVANMGEIGYQLPRKVSFILKNTGSEPLQINEVIPSCGCMSVEWTRTPIEPGGEGEISTAYDAKMLGVFQKDLEVYTNASEQPFYLHVQGRVVAKLSDYSGTFPIDLGNVRLNVNTIEFENVNRGDHPVAELQIANMDRKSYRPQLMHLPPYLTAQYFPEVLSGGRIGKIFLTLDSEKLQQMGLTQTSVYLSRRMGDRVGEENEISVSAVLLPDFSSLSAKERASAPRMTLSADTVDMGAMERKSKKTAYITIQNTGKSALEIRSLQVFNKALTVSLGNRTIAPGKSVRLKVTVWAQYLKKAKSQPRVLLITNDPANAQKIITVNVKQ